MGEARRRGTREERKATAIARDQAEPERHQPKEEADRPVLINIVGRRIFTTVLGIAAAMGMRRGP